MTAAHAMRHLPLAERNAAIEASDDVLDARPELARRIEQRLLALRYRKAFRGGPNKHA